MNYVLCHILAEMSRFTHFPRHKMSAARHLKLFCTPDDDDDDDDNDNDNDDDVTC